MLRFVLVLLLLAIATTQSQAACSLCAGSGTPLSSFSDIVPLKGHPNCNSLQSTGLDDLLATDPNVTCARLQTTVGYVCGCPFPKPSKGQCTICADGRFMPPNPKAIPVPNSRATCHLFAATLQTSIASGKFTCSQLQAQIGSKCGCCSSSSRGLFLNYRQKQPGCGRGSK